MSPALIAQVAGDLRWIRVEDASATVACRAAALALAGRLEFPAARADEVALAVTEAASNLHKHASQGAMLLRIGRDGGKPGIEMVTIDAGPGLADTSAALRDGHSTSGTLGIGLGAIRRLADVCELYSAPGHGTVLVAKFWAVPRTDEIRYAGLIRPITGETECGDVFGVTETDGTVTGVLCDGLGHGPLAAIAAMEAVTAILEEPVAEPAALVERAHRRMNHTRGGAVGVVQIAGPVVLFAGLGNIAAVILADGTRKSMLSVPGIAGHQARTIRQFEYTAPPGAAIILHSDGISSRWEPRGLPGLNARNPLVVAAAVLAEAGTRRDDAGVLVLKP
ncbi:MAG: putative magnesium/manganese-dependent protein phosphatase [Actinomycetia bacterium]|nr:putative magnesium/manganese-dependent protein phosphatase [Actinomycetes bacterium]